MRLLLSLVMVVIVAAACSDGPTEPEMTGPVLVGSNLLSTSGEGPYYRCLFIRPTNTPPIQRKPLDLVKLGMQEASSRERTSFTVRTFSRDGGGMVSYLRCWIPDTEDAINAMYTLFGIPNTRVERDCYDPVTEIWSCDTEGVGVTVDREEPDECDPYEELDFSCDDPCVESEIPSGLDGTMRSNSCETGGGGGDTGTTGGGGGGDGTGYIHPSSEEGYPPDSSFEEECRRRWITAGYVCESRDPNLHEAPVIQEIIESMELLETCPASVISGLRNATFKIWDARVAPGWSGLPTYGHPEDGYIHMWSGVGREAGDPPVDWGRTMVHELGHLMGLSHGAPIDHLVIACGFQPLDRG